MLLSFSIRRFFQIRFGRRQLADCISDYAASFFIEFSRLMVISFSFSAEASFSAEIQLMPHCCRDDIAIDTPRFSQLIAFSQAAIAMPPDAAAAAFDMIFAITPATLLPLAAIIFAAIYAFLAPPELRISDCRWPIYAFLH